MIKNRQSILSFFLSLFCFLGVAGNPFLLAQTISRDSSPDRNAVMAREEFRRGVQAFNRYGYNEAILSFEKALSYKPGEKLILDWLGRSYYQTGLEDTALRQWQSALSGYEAASSEGLLLSNRIETVRNRRSLFPELDDTARYVEAGTISNKNGDISIYKQPTSVLPNSDGTTWVVAYGSNELIRLDQNGLVIQRVRGPINGFDRPYDLARGKNGTLYVSEYRGARVSVLDAKGNWKAYIGERGRGNGQFVGPQNLSCDEDGYLYVVDFGNRRVSKFDPEGKFLLSFGSSPLNSDSGSFRGFRSPTGIAVQAGEVYVADSALQRIVRFDSSGNYQAVFLSEGLSYPESLRFDGAGRLLIADTKRVLLADTHTGSLQELGGLGNANVRIVGADVDRNGNIVVANFAAGEVSLLARMDDLAAGLFVQIERVISDRFPEITVELRVQDRRRRPVVGLEARNFILSESGRPVAGQEFLGAAYLSKRSDISILIERSLETRPLLKDLETAVRDASSAADRVLALVSAGEQPIKENIGSGAELLQAARSRTPSYTPRWNFDLGLRLAATELLAGEKKRAVVFISSGKLGEKSFERYGLSELASYLANNGIVFYTVVLSDTAVDKELRYLCEQTGGQVLSLYRNEGIAPVIAALREGPSGSYALKYSSKLPTDFGRAYLGLEAEAYLMERSGRDALGYFPPLE